ncbi:hypothetical protein L7H23_18400 [Sphingopyxis sp. BSN-002]|uniref:hypothetical protein n=1 Tax=Sphingopyxis sp. BSN-002 TaxID=2911495 RepID=UPI001EDAA483|nr:hypothetical protein [Sphingopyxis sp. BSN-002]UKK84514.1 hypothetical protein L7H23_18400 [Sphingopyxis sp. BSN-002]
MPRTRNRLINAARRSMLQRAELHRRLDVAKEALKPKALYARGKYNVDAKVDEAAHVVRRQFRENRLPIALAAVAGLAWIFREPIKEHAPRLAQKVQDLADAAMAKFQSATGEGPADDEDLTEDRNEAAE